MTQDIKPTRSELMKLKKKIKLAQTGHKLLKKKRDGLILAFFDVLKQAKTVRKELTEEYKKARIKRDMAAAIEGIISMKSAALALKDVPLVEAQRKNIMGVVVPKMKASAVRKVLKERGYGLVKTSAAIDEATESYEKVLEKVILAAEYETAMIKLLKEIEKTKRRVNALEFNLMPKMQKQQSFIRLRLEEMERENIFRLKRIKAKAVQAAKAEMAA